MKVVIVGGIAGGMTTAVNFKKLSKDTKIIVFEKNEFISYSACAMPYFLAGEINSIEKLILYTPEQIKTKFSIDVRTNSEVIKINKRQKKVSVIDKINNKEYEENYDKLVLATGAKPFIPSIEGITKFRNIFTLRTINDAIAINNYLQNNIVKKAVIIGAGLIGLEVGEALIRRGCSVTYIEIKKNLLKILPDDLSEQLITLLKNYNVEILTETLIEKIDGDDINKKATTIKTNKKDIECDIIILSTGIKAEIELAKEAGLEINKNYSVIETNKKQQTSEEMIYAVGDCTNTYNLINNKITYIPLATTARKQAAVTANNLINNNTIFNGMLNCWCTRFMDIEIAGVGLSLYEAENSNFSAKSATYELSSLPDYINRKNDLYINYVWDKKSNRLLGAFLLGYGGTVYRANILAASITGRLTMKEISDMDLSYSPIFNTVFDPITIAAKKSY
ncbi:MAG TPA: FAD-dependent oxidoreductase [bacterium]|nr:FAD-dependent oxidoreductase [bacterium]HOL47515.1 FAD-dependent oxidoreductase [bacterium]HPQ18821.1 FAD-dependent oxidoreductase [bacterium]